MEEQKTYYEIDEQAAYAAKRANSFRDYEKNSATTSYRNYVDSFNKSVDDMIKNNPDNYKKNKEKIDRLKTSYARKLATGMNERSRIVAAVPSIMITGAGNFPVRKKQQQNNRRDTWHQKYSNLFEDDNYIYNKIEGILHNNAIYSNESGAVSQLNTKLSKLQKKQEEMKSINAYYRKNKTMKGYKGLSEKEAIAFDKTIQSSYSKKPYESFELQNNLGRINQVKTRISNINTLKTSSKSNYQTIDGLEVIENKEQMRLQLKFDGKPDEKTRELLKSRGFRWSPKNGTWQRQLTNNAKMATRHVLDELNAQKPKASTSAKTTLNNDWRSNVNAKAKAKPKRKKAYAKPVITSEFDDIASAEERVFFAPYHKTRSGKIIYAKDYGLKAFKMGGN